MNATPNDAACEASSQSDLEITLAVLNAVHENSALTQRSVAQQLGMALGLVNAYLKRCVTKGYVKISQVPRRRYAYYLTPTGFAEKRRLTAEYLRQSFKFIQAARRDCERELEICRANGWSRLILAGQGDFADVALLCGRDRGVELVAIVDPAGERRLYHGVPVVGQLAEVTGPWDAILVTDVIDPQAVVDALCRQVPPERLRTPRLLGVVSPASEA
jgi:DNA-binding MarR family transcriptional regulator